MQDKHLCWPPYFFLGPAVPPFFNSRIATERGSVRVPHFLGEMISCFSMLMRHEIF